MSDTVPTSRVGTQFGPYRLRRLLGRGGLGEVDEAHGTQKDRTVALKLMSQEFNSNSVFRRRMQREAQALGFVTAQAARWRECAGKTVTQTNSGKSSQWAFRQVTGDRLKISLLRDPAGGPKDVTCEHVLSAVSNLVLDVNVCAPQVTDQAGQVADAMAANVPK